MLQREGQNMSTLHALNNNKNYSETINPFTEEVIQQHQIQTLAEAENTIEAADKAFQNWKNVELSKRTKIINNIAKVLQDKKDEIAALMTKEMGKPIKQSKQEVDNCIAICQYTAQNGPEMLKDESRDFNGGKGIITYQPLGVILGIEPWNFPLYQVVRYSVPNLLAGNTTVLKHAKNVWGSAKLIQQIYLDAGIPEGAFGLLFLDNEDMEDIIAHEKIQGVTLTGSEGAGKAVAKTAGANLKRTLLELGGSDPYIILEDADLNSAVEICVQGRVNNSGQTCVAAKRFIIVEQIYDEFKEKFTAAMKAVSYGNPTDPESDMGPMARKDLREDLHEQVQESVKKGAICLLEEKFQTKRVSFILQQSWRT